MHAERRGLRARGLAALALLVAALARAAPAAEEHWFEVRIAGVPSGYVHESLEADGAGGRTRVESLLVLNRLEARVEMAEDSSALEDAAGLLLSLHYEARASRDATVLDLAVRDGELLITTAAGGRSYRRTAREARTLLGPEGIRRLTAARLAEGAATIRYATFVPELGAVAEVTRRVTGRETGSGAPRYVLEETADLMPAATRLVVDERAQVLEESQQGPFGEVRLLAASAAVRGTVAAGAPLPEELYTRALVHANVRLPEPRAIERLRVRIDLRNPASGLPELEAPYQHVLERAADHVVLEIRRAPLPASAPATPGGAAPYTAPNYILQSDHPAVAALAAALRRPGLGRYAQARVLQDWVAEHMRIDAGLAMLPASEVVRDRGGTCVAYSVLLASLARALGIPARIVMGYVYLAGVFGGHAWTEIEVGGRWIPLDAAVYRAGPADATHIAIVRHSGEHGAASGAQELAQVFGNESIRILGYERDGAWVEVPADAPPYRIEAERYRNPWLGLTLARPAGYSFDKADAVYPDATVIALRGDVGEVRLLQSGVRSKRMGAAEWLAAAGYRAGRAAGRIAGRSAVRGVRGGNVALAFRDGEDLWVLEAEGAAAGDALAAAAAGLALEPRGARPR